MRTFKIASFFSGCGGMDLGAEGGFEFLGEKFKKLNTQTVFATDFDGGACEIYNLNFKIKCLQTDIRSLESSNIPGHDILTGGFPCQSFSVVAQNPKRLGYEDEKGKLFFEMCRILRDKKPRAFVAENVKGLLSANKGEAFPLILEEFRKAGYHVQYRLINASHFGVPQKRERVFIVGFRDKNAFDNFLFPIGQKTGTPTPIRRILEDEIEETHFFSKRAVEGMRNSKNSKNMNKGRAQNIDQPCNTVTSHLAKVSLNSTDPVLFENNRYRMFTPREVARIQSFPEKFKLLDVKGKNYRALGNAVAPVVMWHITKHLINALES
jgi:DNA (cytosine-5)-methyltransferase 1